MWRCLGEARLGPALSWWRNQVWCCPVRGFACSCPGPQPGREFLQLPPGSRAPGSARSDTGLGLSSREPRGALVSQRSELWGQPAAHHQPPVHGASGLRPSESPHAWGFSQGPLLGPISLLSREVGGRQVCRPLRPGMGNKLALGLALETGPDPGQGGSDAQNEAIGATFACWACLLLLLSARQPGALKMS